jgi:Co/Zn/Cd efflux system component
MLTCYLKTPMRCLQCRYNKDRRASCRVCWAPRLIKQRGQVCNSSGRDNNMRAAIVHVMADAAVSVLVIIGLLVRSSKGEKNWKF